jgi:hypothetical protein
MRKSPPGPERGPSALPAPRAARQDAPSTMDIERINAIGTTIADLSERTNALRGYL